MCDAVRDISAAISCGLCEAIDANSKKPIPPSCPALKDPVTLCNFPKAANDEFRLIDLAFKNDLVSNAERKIYKDTIDKSNEAISKLYQTPQLSWSDFELCRVDTDKTSPYFTRNDVIALGMTPTYPIGGNTAMKMKVPYADTVPLFVDYYMNTHLFIIMMVVVFILISITGIILIKKYTQKNDVSVP